MLKRTISYEDFDGNPAEDVFYFHLSEAELLEMESSYEGGFSSAMQRIVANEDMHKLIKEFKNLVLLAYGERSEDGKIFRKSEELSKEFSQHAAYSALFMELATNSDKASEFINGIVPKKLVQQAEQDKPVGPPPAPLASPTPQANL